MSTEVTSTEATSTEATSTAEDAPEQSPGAAFAGIMSTAVGYVAAKATRQTDEWASSLTAVAEAGGWGGGAREQAALRAAEAHGQGRNPVWAAIKGTWSGGGAKIRAAIVTAVVSLVVLALVSPVLLLVYLLSLLVIAAVMKARSGNR